MERGGAFGQVRDWLGAARSARRGALAGLVAAALLALAGAWAVQGAASAERGRVEAALASAADAAAARLIGDLAQLDAALARLAAGEAPGSTPALARRMAAASRNAFDPDAALKVPPTLLTAALAGGSAAMLGPFPDPRTGEPLLVRALGLGGETDMQVAIAEIEAGAMAALLAPLAQPAPLRLGLETEAGLAVLATGGLGVQGPQLRRPLEGTGLTLVAAWPSDATSGWLARGLGVLGASALLLAGLLGVLGHRRPDGRDGASCRLTAAVEALPEAFVLWDAQDRLVACNARFRALFPLAAGATFRPGLSRAAAATALRPAARLAAGGSPFALPSAAADAPPQELARADGTRLLAAEWRLPGGGRLGLYRDASALHRAEAARAATVPRSFLLPHLSQALRAPLTSLLQLTDQLGREAPLAERPRREAEMLNAAARHLLALADGVPGFGALDAAGLSLKPEEAAVPALLEAVVATARPIAEARQVRLALDCEALPPVATRDAERLRQVLPSLLTAAVKLSPAGGEVRLEGWRSDQRLCLAVTDPKPRVPAAEHDRPSRDVSRLRPGTEDGMGLSLASSARLVARMGGEIGCEGAGGAGARVLVTLPFVPPAAQARPEPAPAPARASTRRRLRLLAVDDSPANLMVLRALLAATGFRLEVRSDAAAGLEALTVAAASGDPYDAVLMDVMMPGMDGLEATRRIRAMPDACGRVPVIAVTASAFPEDVAACIAAGMTGHVPKPVERMALLRALATALGGGGAPAPGAAGEDDELAALRPAFLAELEARLAELRAGGPAIADTVHAICGTVGHLGAADLAAQARTALRALRERAPDAPALVDKLAERIVWRFPGLRSGSMAA